jgi:hypothetical protein
VNNKCSNEQNADHFYLPREDFPESFLMGHIHDVDFGGNFALYEDLKLLTAGVSRLLSAHEGRNQYFQKLKRSCTITIYILYKYM